MNRPVSLAKPVANSRPIMGRDFEISEININIYIFILKTNESTGSAGETGRFISRILDP